MGFFRKKKLNTPEKEHDYTQCEKELFFLNLILTRKKNISKEFLIGVYNTQLTEKDYLRDEDIDEIIYKIVDEIVVEIGENYKNFLIKHYFGSIENLIKFISEDVYVELISDAINRNSNKSRTLLAKRASNMVSKLNNK